MKYEFELVFKEAEWGKETFEANTETEMLEILNAFRIRCDKIVENWQIAGVENEDCCWFADNSKSEGLTEKVKILIANDFE